MAVLLLLFALIPSIDAVIRVKRQYGSPTHIRQWSVDQESFHQPLEYRESYTGTGNYYPNADYYNYYTQRELVPHQAPRYWTLNGYNSYNYMYPYSSYNTHPSYHSSGYPTKPDSSGAGSSYGRPRVSGEVTQAPAHNNVPIAFTSPSNDEYPTAPPEWQGGANGRFFARPSSAHPSKATTKEISSVKYFEGEGFDENGPFTSHGVEVTREGEPTSLEESFLKVGLEGDLSTTQDPSSTLFEENNGESSSTTSAPSEGEVNSNNNHATRDFDVGVETSTTFSPDRSFTTPQELPDEATVLFVDSDDSQPSSSTGSVTGISGFGSLADSSVPPLDKAIPTEVPAASSSDVTEGYSEATSLGTTDDSVILRSPPLPKQVAEKLKELGFSVLKFFS
ncbi:hypothetical protein GCK32_003033 [Trichostrongylus colubriformis]|uniref:Uncharacterized protein n=1 Tax=Trichostrongylus colubriformis TaxID=6319 RepID=A0AAN8FR03_TRICO